MILIVGCGAAGLAAAETLRDLGYGDGLRILDCESRTGYERPVLSKRFLVDSELSEPPAVIAPTVLAERGISPEPGTRVVALERSRQQAVTAAGERIAYERLLLATGAEPRRLTLPGAGAAGIHYLRTADEARGLREALATGGRVAVVGGGVIGLEVASSAVALNLPVTVIEAATQILGRLVPPPLARTLLELHQARGVTFRLGQSPVAFAQNEGNVRGVVLADGTTVAAETVVVGVGSAPRTRLAAEAELAVDDGILVDGSFRTADERIFACGDAARVEHEGEGRAVRMEQWAPAQEQGRRAAAAMLEIHEAYREIPWMWSDQHDFHLQATGFGFGGAEITCRGAVAAPGGLVYFGTRGGRLTAACGVSLGTGIARTIRSAQALIGRQATVPTDQLADPRIDLRRLATAMAAASPATNSPPA